MRMVKSLSLMGVVLVIVALLGATNAFAQSFCTSETTSHGTGNFRVDVAQTVLDGRTTYTYTMSSPTGKSPNKFFMYVRDGLQGNLVSSVCDSTTGCSVQGHVDHNASGGSSPATDVWKVNRHEDAVFITSVAIHKVIKVDVSNRFQPEDSLTSIVLGIGSTFEHCGPIFGPTNPEAPSFPGSQVLNTTMEQTLVMSGPSGDTTCTVDLEMEGRSNIVKNVTLLSGDCVIEVSPDSCAQHQGGGYCSEVRGGDPPTTHPGHGAGAGTGITDLTCAHKHYSPNTTVYKKWC